MSHPPPAPTSQQDLTPADQPFPHAVTVLPGLTVTVAIALLATWLGGLLPIVGGAMAGILLGAVAGVVLRRKSSRERHEVLGRGFTVAAKRVLPCSIVLLGTGLPLNEVLRVGGSSAPVLLGTLVVALGGGWLLGRLLGIHRETAILIGAGTGICGASAIAAVTAVIGAAEARVAYAIGTIFTFNIAAVVLFPPLGHLFGLSQHGFGLWAGTAVNDTSSVVAASYTYGTAAGAYAVVVKLTRSLAIVPVCLVLRAWQVRRSGPGEQRVSAGTAWRAFPWFVIGFLAASAASTLGAVPASWQPGIAHLGAFLVTTALTGVGLSLDPAHLRRAGVRPLLFGGALWVAVAVACLGLQALTRQL